MKCPLAEHQKRLLREFCITKWGELYRYRSWQRMNDYWTGFVSCECSTGRRELGLILRDDDSITLVCNNLIREFDPADFGC